MYILEGNGCCITEELKKNILHYIINNGIIILRNYSVDLEKFSKFIGLICSRVTNDPARNSSSKNAQFINASNVEMGLHLENGNAPFVPDLQFFLFRIYSR